MIWVCVTSQVWKESEQKRHVHWTEGCSSSMRANTWDSLVQSIHAIRSTPHLGTAVHLETRVCSESFPDSIYLEWFQLVVICDGRSLGVRGVCISSWMLTWMGCLEKDLTFASCSLNWLDHCIFSEDRVKINQVICVTPYIRWVSLCCYIAEKQYIYMYVYRYIYVFIVYNLI